MQLSRNFEICEFWIVQISFSYYSILCQFILKFVIIEWLRNDND